MKTAYFKIILLQLFMLLYFANYSQVNKTGIPFYKNFSPKEYKAHNLNWAVIRDKRGLMYVGNNDNGVLEYDGKSWRQIPVPNNSIVRSLAVDTSGIVFVGATGEFGYLEPNASGKLQYKSLINKVDTSKHKVSTIWKTYVTNKNEILFCSMKYIFKYKNNKIEPINLPDGSFWSFYVDGQLYIGNWQEGKGLLKLDGNKVIKAPGGDFFVDDDILKILPYKKNKLIIFTYKGLFIYNTFDGNIIKPEKDSQFDKTNKFLKENIAYNGALINDNFYAWATKSSGVVIAEKKGKIIENYTDSTGLQDKMVSDVFYCQDEGVLWSTLSNGISKFEFHSPLRYFGPESKIDGTINEICRYKSKLYVGTSLGLYYLDSNQDGLASFKKVFDFNGQSVNSMSILEVDGKQHLIIGTSNNVLEIVDGKVKDFNRPVNSIYAYVVCGSKFKKNTFYIGTEKGLIIANSNNGIWNLTPENNEIVKAEIRSMAEDNEGNLWLGTLVDGVYKISPEGKITKFTTKDGLPVLNDIKVANTISGLVFATIKGFYSFDAKKNTFHPFEPFKNDLTKNKRNIISVFPGFNNQVWMNIDNRVYKFIKHYSDFRVDTIPFRRLPQMALQVIYSDPDGLTWIGGSEGLYCYDNFFKRKYDVPFNTLIRSVSINKNDSVLFDGTNYRLNNGSFIPSLIQPAELKPTLEYRFNALTFNFAAPYYEDEANILYSYFLDGFDEDWSKWSSDNKAVYTNLKEGKYIFKVKARNVFASESTEAHYEFEISPPWYRTIIAYIGYGVVAIFILIFSVKIYTRKLEADKKRLEGIVVERTAEIVKQKDEILDKNKEIEFINKEITSSIRYAKRIQEALLPSGDTINTTDLEFFIYFRPKDIVSGDFYFLKKIERSNILIAAAADCTGHGVPGAFMSMLGISFLNEIIVKPDVTSSDVVLNHLRESIIESLNQSGREGETKDGMDISLIAYHYKEHKLEFSGANNPLYLVRNDELQEFKPDKMPIGLHDKSNVPFSCQKIDIQVGDIIYLFSDGFADQFGGDKGRKYMYKRFKERLVEIHKHTMEEQRHILEQEMIDWRGELEQIDDHIVMGIKFVS